MGYVRECTQTQKACVIRSGLAGINTIFKMFNLRLEVPQVVHR